MTTLESSVINNTITIQIALLAWLFLGEPLGATEILALLLVLAGIVLVQWRRRRSS